MRNNRLLTFNFRLLVKVLVVTNSKIESYFSVDDEFTNKDGQMYAFAITSLDGEVEPIGLDYGTLKAFKRELGLSILNIDLQKLKRYK